MPENPAGFGQPDADPDEIPTEPTSPPAAGAAAAADQAAAGGSGSAGAPGSGRPVESPNAEAGAAGSGEGREDGTAPDAGSPQAAGSPDTAGSPEATGPDTAGSPDRGATRADTASPSLTDSGADGAGRRTPRERRSPAADEAAFLELIARFDQEPPPGERLWPAAEDVDEPRRPSVIIIRPAGRQPDGMPPDGRHLAGDDTDPGTERTEPPSPLGRGTDGAAPVDLDGTGADHPNADLTGADPAGTDHTGAGKAGTGRQGGGRGEAGADDEADRAGNSRGRDNRSPLDGIAGLDAAVRAAFGTAGRDAPEYPGADDDDHYVPPPPPPVPKLRPVTRWALGSIALGVAILVVPTLIGLNHSRSQDVAGVLLILGGVGTLVARMGDRPPTDFDGPDDGAVV
ncbi:conserved hypothetical protein [Parafrankia sp. EAN1pec]|uniref:hypothetical protein n=1 Tax=Parafrankia sp. (strain EAN1pec) TaxID=298653 RepID=UPI0000541276|nr:conserved hypothetical protein [Frankia sp. EAN1pec]